MFNWSGIEFILKAESVEEIYNIAHREFKCIIENTACFDSFSEKVKIHRLNQVIQVLADKINISLEKSKDVLLNEYYKQQKSWFSIDIDGFDRPTIGHKPYVEAEDIYTTKYSSGYLLPDGTFYGCESEGHYYLCCELQRAKIIPEFLDAYAYPDENCWIKINHFRKGEILNFHNANQLQLDIIQKLNI
jgi:hypothetical protein